MNSGNRSRRRPPELPFEQRQHLAQRSRGQRIAIKYVLVLEDAAKLDGCLGEGVPGASGDVLKLA